MHSSMYDACASAAQSLPGLRVKIKVAVVARLGSKIDLVVTHDL